MFDDDDAPRIRSYPREARVHVLTPEDEDLIHRRSLDVLERAGVSTTNERVLRLLAEHGQDVDLDAKRVRFDPVFVEEKLALAGRTFTLAGREPDLDLVIDGERGYLSTDGCPADVLDLDTKQRRPGTKQDLMDLTRIGDALSQVGFFWQPVSANDTPVPVRPIHETHAQLLSTSKHIQQMTAIDGFNAKGVLEMAIAIAGSSEAFAERPFLSNFQCAISPLHWDHGPLDAMELFATAGMAVGICSMPLAAASAPVTMAGTITMVNAEVLSGIAILETLAPGADAFYVGYPTTIDLQSGAMNAAWGAEETFSQMANTQMARRYGLPSTATCMATGSKASDWQAGVQSMLMTMANMLMPADMLTGVGSLDGDNVFSAVEMLLDAEIYDIALDWANGYRISEEDIALDVILEVGPGGHFLDSEHTLTNMKEIWRTSLMNRKNWEAWNAEGRPDPTVAAEAEARRILAEHHPEPVASDVAAELERIVDAYQAQAVAEAS
jgi:trimethylamine--corrinoid protein Co-methyltransferase